MRVSQCGGVAAIRSQAVAEGALAPKLTEEVIGSASGDDLMTHNFRVLRQLSAHAAWRNTQRSDEVRMTGNSVKPVHSVFEDHRRALEHRRWCPMRIELT